MSGLSCCLWLSRVTPVFAAYSSSQPSERKQSWGVSKDSKSQQAMWENIMKRTQFELSLMWFNTCCVYQSEFTLRSVQFNCSEKAMWCWIDPKTVSEPTMLWKHFLSSYFWPINEDVFGMPFQPFWVFFCLLVCPIICNEKSNQQMHQKYKFLLFLRFSNWTNRESFGILQLDIFCMLHCVKWKY